MRFDVKLRILHDRSVTEKTGSGGGGMGGKITKENLLSTCENATFHWGFLLFYK